MAGHHAPLLLGQLFLRVKNTSVGKKTEKIVRNEKKTREVVHFSLSGKMTRVLHFLAAENTLSL